MPIYEYVCVDCGEKFEKMVRFSEMDQSPDCPQCQGKDTHKKLSLVSNFSISSGFLGGRSGGCGSSGGFS